MSDPKKNFVANEAELKSLCRAFTRKNVETLGGWATGDNIDDELKMRAIAMLFDRGWGKPESNTTAKITGADGEGPLVVEIVYQPRDKK